MYQNVVKLLGATSLSQLLPILILPILTNQLSLEAFGFLGSYISLILIVSIFVTLRLEPSIVLCGKDSYFQAENIRTITIYTTVFVALILSIVQVFYETPVQVLICFVVTVFSFSNTKVIEQFLTEKERYSEVSKNKVTLSLVTSLLHLCAAFAIGEGDYLLIYSYTLSFLICNIYFLYKSNLRVFPFLKVKKLELLLEHKKFSKFELPSDFIFQLSQNLPIVIIMTVFGAEIAGFYSLAEKIILLPVSMIGSTLGVVYYREMSKEKGNLAQSKQTKLILNGLFGLVVAGAFIYYFCIDYLIKFAFNDDYVGLSVYTDYLILYGIVLFVSSPLSGALWKAGKQNINLMLSVITFIFRCCLFYIVSLNFTFHSALLFLIVSSIFPRVLLFCFCMKHLSLNNLEIVIYNILLFSILFVSYQVFI
ncbi:lipopolysaccharide biosynthesis protein [Shewanella algae]|uniref:lipopolysaccharide biosynthesis protein n=1 Tax=Shewanella algae TaxID=38313 RepID=UPI001AAFD3DA|nr:oligosaccharide flippase family protein [Shewanella algae]MBO2581704.1 oligosaccharide flippase family protein [Shewanella algae]